MDVAAITEVRLMLKVNVSSGGDTWKREGVCKGVSKQ